MISASEQCRVYIWVGMETPSCGISLVPPPQEHASNSGRAQWAQN